MNRDGTSAVTELRALLKKTLDDYTMRTFTTTDVPLTSGDALTALLLLVIDEVQGAQHPTTRTGGR